MSHACRGIGAFAHAIVLGSRIVLNRTSSATAAALLLASVSVPSAALAQGLGGPTKMETPLVDSVYNPCSQETVDIVGTTDLFIYLKAKNNGSTDITTRIKHRGTGTSLTTGATYNFHSDETVKFSDVPPGGFDSAVLTKTMLVRQDTGAEVSADDWMFKNTMRIKIDEFGNVLINREKITETCPVE